MEKEFNNVSKKGYLLLIDGTCWSILGMASLKYNVVSKIGGVVAYIGKLRVGLGDEFF